MEKGRITFTCTDKLLNDGFAWAKRQALSYAHEGDLVGDWYEAALPNRQSFCMRDVAHQCMGGEALGLHSHNKNMLLRFAQSIAESRDFCSFWEIDSDYRPTRVDYSSDNDFWYNLPANFDLMDACRRVFCRSGDPALTHSSDFTRFYDTTICEYVRHWDTNGDGILERIPGTGRRGIPSYDEDNGFSKAEVMSDLVSIQIRGYLSCAELARQRNLNDISAECELCAARLLQVLQREWWDGQAGKFYAMRAPDGRMLHGGGHAVALCYYSVLTDDAKRLAHLDQLHNAALNSLPQVEGLSHLGETFYKNGQPERGLYWLRKMIDPATPRREYPELSYAVVDVFVRYLAGIDCNAAEQSITITPDFAASGSYTVGNLPFLGGEIDVTATGENITVVNRTSVEITVNTVNGKIILLQLDS